MIKKNVHAVKVNIRIRIFLPCYLTTTYIKTRKLMKEIGDSNAFYNYAMAPMFESIILCKFNSLSLSLSRSLFLSLSVSANTLFAICLLHIVSPCIYLIYNMVTNTYYVYNKSFNFLLQ